MTSVSGSYFMLHASFDVIRGLVQATFASEARKKRSVIARKFYSVP